MILELLAKRHSEWLRMVASFGADRDTSHDVVQDMYLRMYRYVDNPERIMYAEGEVNTYFVFVVLRNLYISSKKKISFESIDEVNIDGSIEDADMEKEEVFDNMINAIWKEVESWHWYDTKLFKVYHNSDMTIKKISEETKITERSIWNTLDNGRKRIQANKGEEYEAWKAYKKE